MTRIKMRDASVVAVGMNSENSIATLTIEGVLTEVSGKWEGVTGLDVEIKSVEHGHRD